MDKKTSKNNLPSLGQMKNKYRLFIFMALLFITSLFLNISNSFALTLTGTDQVTTSSSTAYTAEGCNGSVTWGVTGVGASISSNGVLTAGSASCGALTVTASCSDGSVATKTARVTNAGQWQVISLCYRLAEGSYFDPYVDCYGGNKWYTVAYINSGYHENKSCSEMDSTYPWICYPLFPEKILTHTCNVHYGVAGYDGVNCYPINDLYPDGPCQFVYYISVREWICPPCTNGQTQSCTSTDCPNGGVQTCTNSQWGACQCDPCKDKDKDGYYAISVDCPKGKDCNDDDPLVYPDNSGCCPVQHLTPLTDPLAISMEEGSNVIYDGLTTNMQQAVDCLSDDVFNAGGGLTITSAYRPPQYQQHLREVWDRYHDLTDEDNPLGSECNTLREEITNEYQRHGLLSTQRPANNSNHSIGTAIDANANLSVGQNIDSIADNCGLYRPNRIGDPVHFQLR